jgi:hypothetical protein
MTIKIQYMDGTYIELQHVKTITLIGIGPIMIAGSIFEITCFGNEPVLHKSVANLDIIGW